MQARASLRCVDGNEDAGVRDRHRGPPRARRTEPAERVARARVVAHLETLLGREAADALERAGDDPGTLERAAPGELAHLLGLSRSRARRLAAALALARELRVLSRPARPSVRSARAVLRLLEDELRGLEREHFWALLLDGKHGLRRVELISVGTLTTSLVHPREVFRPALREAAAAVVCAHNHPSGDPEPSAEDLEVTRRLLDAGRLLGVPLLDHVVLGDARALSLRERMGF